MAQVSLMTTIMSLDLLHKKGEETKSEPSITIKMKERAPSP